MGNTAQKVKAKQVLIVEDDLSIRDVLAQKITDCGYEVILSGDGQEGLDLALDKDPDLILLDLQLPKLNGKELLKKVRNDEKSKRIPVIILTNDGSSMSIEDTLNKGTPAYFIKSDTSLAEIVEAIKYHLV